MDLSIIIPAFNEEKRLPATLESVIAFMDQHKSVYELIVVDDGSTDNTREVTHLVSGSIRVIRYEANRGKGYAIQQGVEEARGKTILFMDADNATPIWELDRLATYLENYPVVIGSRYCPESLIQRKQPWYRRVIGRLGNRLIQASLLKGIRDTQCGFKLFDAHVAKSLFSKLKTERFGFDIEILARAIQEGHEIAEVPVSWIHQGESRVRPFKDSLRTFKDFIRIRKECSRLTK